MDEMTEREIADSGRIYSPEASDDDPHGDWQTKLVASAIVVVVIGIAVFAWWRLF